MLIPQNEFKRLQLTLSGETSFEAELPVSADIQYFNGHFPGAPVLPAIGIIDASLVAISQFMKSEKSLRKARSAKFFAPVIPGTQVKISGQKTEGGWNIQWAADGKNLASLSLETD
jgi:3-hydroxymyristoyl/3-hydroxydecanoyl-(acyl carrier protein) dehydratase